MGHYKHVGNEYASIEPNYSVYRKFVGKFVLRILLPPSGVHRPGTLVIAQYQQAKAAKYCCGLRFSDTQIGVFNAIWDTRHPWKVKLMKMKHFYPESVLDNAATGQAADVLELQRLCVQEFQRVVKEQMGDNTNKADIAILYNLNFSVLSLKIWLTSVGKALGSTYLPFPELEEELRKLREKKKT